MRRIAILLLTAIVLFSFVGFSAFAAEIPETIVQPRWDNTLTINYIFEFEETHICYAEIAVTGQPGVNKIVGDVQIYRQDGSSWTWVAGDTKTVNSGAILMSVEHTGISGKYYKAVFTMTVYKNGVGEEIVRTCYDTCPTP
jgi:hypothetical protein